MSTHYARTVEGRPKSAWQRLHEHLDQVAARASVSAGVFGSRDWGYCAGLWHDLGKYSSEFQAKLDGKQIQVEHSGVGAAFASGRHKERGLPLAFAIAGHHAGLADYITAEPGLPKPLKERLNENVALTQKLSPLFSSKIASQQIPDFPQFLSFLQSGERVEKEAQSRRMELWIRFLFSALVDADRLDSEEFCQPEKAARRSLFPNIETLCERIDSFIDVTQAALPASVKDSPVNRTRQFVASACREAASQARGAFSLTVPTGGGKTLSAMSFALHHAQIHNLRRVIVVIPYTSIIEQNAEVYRKALGTEAVVEHQSSLDPKERRTKYGEETTSRAELAAENWDAPVIVTTTVQFFESVFSNRPSRCRKLHNIAGSVIVLDEVQTLPTAFLHSILDALNELVRSYRCSVVLSTATPPALKWRAGFDLGLRDCREIVPSLQQLANQLKRVEYIWPDDNARELDPKELAAELAKHPRVLAIVHRREDARLTAQRLEEFVNGGSVYHLSALMCPSHRSQTIDQIKKTLERGAPCRVVSTQLVEAGVDVDFPFVYRALGGLDSIVQAAGRCNREGRIDRGRVLIFRAHSAPPRGTPMRALGVTNCLLREHGGSLDLDDPAIFEDYFRQLYFLEDLDPRGIQTLRQEFRFASVSREFQMIEDGFTHVVVVPFGNASARLDELRRLGPTRETTRGLQAFTVNIYPDAFQKLSDAGALEEIMESTWAVTGSFSNLYSEKYGLVIPAGYFGIGQAGVTIRETLNPAAAEVTAFWGWNPAAYLEARTATGANAEILNGYGTGGFTPPVWLKLVRAGNVFTGYASSDGVNWTQLGSTTVPMTQTVYIGLVVSSDNDSPLETARFDSVSSSSTISPAPLITSLSATTASIGSQVAINGLNFGDLQNASQVLLNDVPMTINTWSNNAISFTIPTAATSGLLVVSVAPSMNDSNPVTLDITSQPLPSPWLDQDVGLVPAGSATFASNVFTVAGGGSIPFTSEPDALHFVYQTLTGDGSIVARLSYLQILGKEAGVMIRSALDADATQVTAIYSGNTYLLARLTAGAATENVTGTAGSLPPPEWLQLVRAGDLFTGYASSDGINWTQLGTTTVSMPQTVYIGLAVSGESGLVSATFDNVLINSTAAPAPVIYNLSATTTSVGSQVEINGLNFGDGNASQVFLNDIQMPVNTWSGNAIVFTIPSGAASGPLVVSVAPSMNDSNPVDLEITTQPLPGPWLNEEVNAPGSATFSGGTFTVTDGGTTGVGGTTDEMQFVYQTLQGDGSIIARVTSPPGSANAGVMIRETLTASSKDAFVYFYPNQAYLMYRLTTGATVDLQAAGYNQPGQYYWLQPGPDPEHLHGIYLA